MNTRGLRPGEYVKFKGYAYSEMHTEKLYCSEGKSWYKISGFGFGTDLIYLYATHGTDAKMRIDRSQICATKRKRKYRLDEIIDAFQLSVIKLNIELSMSEQIELIKQIKKELKG